MAVQEAIRFYAKILGAENLDIDRVIEDLDLPAIISKNFNMLSQGQKKRVSIARTLYRH
jgi:ABC-type multidrug transport system ATPase subunit